MKTLLLSALFCAAAWGRARGGLRQSRIQAVRSGRQNRFRTHRRRHGESARALRSEGRHLAEAKFVVKLPAAWNERFQMVGNGGWAGSISTAAVDAAVRLGYASTSTDHGPRRSRKKPARHGP
ncbi:MAG: tannase/feruloyl esterase family alpha/beta hydrolase [Acidobacteriota bacterium]